MNKRIFLAGAALAILAGGQVSRANEPPDPLLNQKRKVALPVWNSIVKTTPAHPSEFMLLIAVLASDAFMHDTIAPERLAAAKAEAVRQPPHGHYGEDYGLAAIAFLQKMTGDEAGFRATRARVDVSQIDDKVRKQLAEDRMTLLRSIPEASVPRKGIKPANEDMPSVLSDDLKPFALLYQQILRSSQEGKRDRTAAMQKTLRRAIKRASSLGEDSNTALGLIASAQARGGDIAGARETARHCGAGSYGEYWALIHIARIQIDWADLVGARQTLNEVDSHLFDKNDVVEALALAQMRAGNGEAALHVLDTIPEPNERLGSKCGCLTDFLAAPYATHLTR